MYFTGMVEHQVDDKYRIRIPKRYRETLPQSTTFYFMKYSKGCIGVFTREALEERLEALKTIRSNQPDLLEAKRKVFQAIEEVKEDNQKRIVLSAAMRSYAGIGKDVITVGMGDYLEIWAADRFASESQGISLEDALARLPM